MSQAARPSTADRCSAGPAGPRDAGPALRRTRLTGGAVVLLAAPLLVPGAAAAPTADDRPTRVSGSSPLAQCARDGLQRGRLFTHAEVEPHMAVDPTDGDNVVAAWQQDRYSNGGAQGIVTASSSDGGATWTVNPRTRSSVCTGGTTANGGSYQRASDPWVSFSPDGTAHLMTLSFDQFRRDGGFGRNAMLAMRSGDGGRTWSEPVTLRADDSPAVLNDKNTITADPHDPRFVYAVWDRVVVPPGTGEFMGPAWFARTTDGGRSWRAARQIYDPGKNSQTVGNQIVVLPDGGRFAGELVNVFELYHLVDADTETIEIALLRSSDRGRSWDATPVVVDDHRVAAVRDPETGDPVRAGDFIPEVAVDADTGALYLVWQDNRFGPPSSVAFTRSLDGGLTWSRTVRVNATPRTLPAGNRQAFTPMVAVAGDGTVAVSYFDFRHNTADPATLLTDAFVVRCRPVATTTCTRTRDWTDEQRLTPASFDMARAPDAFGLFVGDYQGLGVDRDERFLPVWAMPHRGDPASVFVRRLVR